MNQNHMISNICPICQLSYSTQFFSCTTCGYDNKEKAIKDDDKLRTYISSFPKDSWPAKIAAKKKVNEIQLNKYGPSSTSTDPEKAGWSINKTAKLLKESNATTSIHIKIADALDEYPQLKLYKTVTAAKKNLSKIQEGGIFQNPESNIEFEKDLQSYLKNNWDETPFSREWLLQGIGGSGTGIYNTDEVGKMDFLARHRNESKWLVIELKLNQSSDETVGQLLRYMGWIKKNHAQKGEEVEGLIIANSADINIYYALKCVPNVRLYIYKMSNDKIEFEDSESFYVKSDIKQLSPEEKLILMEVLKNI